MLIVTVAAQACEPIAGRGAQVVNLCSAFDAVQLAPQSLEDRPPGMIVRLRR